MSVIISLSIWKEAWRIAGGLVLRASTSEGAEENKESTANLIIISHLFRELMWCLRCQAALFLSHSALFLSSPIPLRFSVSYTHPLLSPCFVAKIGPCSRGFDEMLSRLNVADWNVILRSDVSETRPVISFGTLNFISSLFSFTSAFTNTIAQWNHLWLPSFSPTYILQRKLYCTLEIKWIRWFLSFWMDLNSSHSPRVPQRSHLS